MSHRYALLLGAVVLVPSITSCSLDDKHSTKEFDTVVTGERLFEAYGQTKNVTTTVRPSTSTRQFIISMDCVNSKGSIRVTLTGPPKLKAFGDVPCTEQSKPGGPDGAVGIELDPKDGAPASVTVTVTAPKDSEWSAAVDSRTSS
jgi:hypothetical protein